MLMYTTNNWHKWYMRKLWC